MIAPKEQSDINSGKNRQTSEEYNKNPKDTEISVTMSMQGPLKVPIAKPGKVVGPVIPCELHLSEVLCFLLRLFTPLIVTKDRALEIKKGQLQQNLIKGTRAGVNGIELDDRIAMDTTSLMPTKAQYGRISAGTTGTSGHRKFDKIIGFHPSPKGLFPRELEHYRGRKLKVAIIGAGFAGMSTAVELLDQGHELSIAMDKYLKQAFVAAVIKFPSALFGCFAYSPF
ncbi:hypothetical protein K1719_027580 [Acacia pycnantha]|nr:hypothetical protein K1719_027580 [Acacia pycnantha]